MQRDDLAGVLSIRTLTRLSLGPLAVNAAHAAPGDIPKQPGRSGFLPCGYKSNLHAGEGSKSHIHDLGAADSESRPPYNG
ncbi:hypothetical protein [Aeromonas popoffii]|uniref:hypothetical protein n=1 Tax=Aeromonas popoffii TaxID=70856 RepID=UPI0012ECE2D4|nr:hypothetical protein [Aeromonas popoffii]